jgi:hypothetical protein
MQWFLVTAQLVCLLFFLCEQQRRQTKQYKTNNGL